MLEEKESLYQSIDRGEVMMQQPDAARESLMRATLPYGKWTCQDGREVLFNRRYRPMWQRKPGQAPEPADPDELVACEDENFFFAKGNPPWRDEQVLSRCREILDRWNLMWPPDPVQELNAKLFFYHKGMPLAPSIREALSRIGYTLTSE